MKVFQNDTKLKKYKKKTNNFQNFLYFFPSTTQNLAVTKNFLKPETNCDTPAGIYSL